MSYTNYQKAINLLPKCKNYFVFKKQPPNVIKKAEQLLSLNFSMQVSDFLMKLGYVSFAGHEIYGISGDNFDDFSILAGNMVESTLSDREKFGLPNEWLTIYFFGFDGYYGYLDHGQLNEEGEPPVIIATYDGEKYVVAEKVAEDFGDFLLELVQNALSEK